MDKEILIAIIASVASLIVACISLITSLITNRQSHKSNKKLEEQKSDLLRKRRVDDIKDTHFDDEVRALKRAIQTIQSMKDEIQIILSARGTSLDSETALHRISKIRESIFFAYEEDTANLTDAGSLLLHQAKNVSLEIENELVDCLIDKDNVSKMSEFDRQSLWQFQVRFTDFQEQLRDLRAERLAKELGYQ